MTPFKGGVKVRDEYASFGSLNLPDLFKTFNLIPNMATFQN